MKLRCYINCCVWWFYVYECVGCRDLAHVDCRAAARGLTLWFAIILERWCCCCLVCVVVVFVSWSCYSLSGIIAHNRVSCVSLLVASTPSSYIPQKQVWFQVPPTAGKRHAVSFTVYPCNTQHTKTIFGMIELAGRCALQRRACEKPTPPSQSSACRPISRGADHTRASDRRS